MKASLNLPEPDLREWARGHLQVAAHASRREARAACLRKVAEYQWLPPAAIEESHEYWARPDGAKFFPSLFEQAFHDEEFRLRGQVEEFARTYFDVNPAQRQKRFQVLVDQCAWSANLRARLHGLAAGLELDRQVWEHAAPEEKELAQHVCQLFSLTPRERAQRRWQLLQELEAPDEPWEPAMARRREKTGKTGIAKWEAAARALQDNYPDVAALEPILVDELAVGAARRQRRRARLPQVRPAASGWVAPNTGQGSTFTVGATGNAPAKSGQSGGAGWLVWVFVVLGISMLRFLSTSNRQPTPPPLPPMPKMPQFQQKWDPKAGRIVRPDEVHVAGDEPAAIRLFGKEVVEKLLSKKPGAGENPAVVPKKDPPMLKQPDRP